MTYWIFLVASGEHQPGSIVQVNNNDLNEWQKTLAKNPGVCVALDSEEGKAAEAQYRPKDVDAAPAVHPTVAAQLADLQATVAALQSQLATGKKG